MGQNTKKQKSALVNQTEHTLELRCVDCDAWVRWIAVRRGAGRSAAQSDYTLQLVTAAMETCVCVCVCVCVSWCRLGVCECVGVGVEAKHVVQSSDTRAYQLSTGSLVVC